MRRLVYGSGAQSTWGQTDPVSETLWFFCLLYTRRWIESKISLIVLYSIHHRQNPLKTTVQCNLTMSQCGRNMPLSLHKIMEQEAVQAMTCKAALKIVFCVCVSATIPASFTIPLLFKFCYKSTCTIMFFFWLLFSLYLKCCSISCTMYDLPGLAAKFP
jgi:hypothetical protein